jgi:nucleotide-binding universal stress UspA family protein
MAESPGHPKHGDLAVVAAVDGSASSLAATATAARIARGAAAPLYLVSVRNGPPEWLGEPYYQRRLDDEMAAARGALEASAGIAAAEGVDAHLEVLEGEPAKRIREFAADHNARCIVLGTRSRRVKRSVSHRVIRDSHRPVVVVGVPPPARSAKV